MVNGYNDNIYLTELWGLTDLIYVKYLAHDWHMINEKSLQSFPKGKGFYSLALPKAQAVMPRKLFRNLLTAHLWYQVCFSVKPAWAILSQWFFSGAKKNRYLSIFWLLNKAVFLQYGRPGFDPWVWKEMETHCSILGWRISWTEEPGGLQSMGLQRVRHDWVTNTLHPQTRLLIP